MSAVDSLPLKAGSFGACGYSAISPKALAADTKAINLVLSFEDALKLNLAVDSCVHYLGRLHRGKAIGKRRGLQLILHFDKRRVRVQVGTLRARE